NKGQLSEATIRSTIGGTLRLRSYVPLTGEGLKPAEGDCPNDLLKPAAVKQPLQSKELNDFSLLPIRQVYEYDIETKSGKTYVVRAQ
ncbi:MAG: glycoside hydrolase family 95 protein, partial [Prevotella sp.]|nr:glycoside hydrolase family 95 protein [Prevotella sp.]